MSELTLAQAQENLSAWIAADLAVSKGQSYSIGGRSMTRADAKAITEKIKFWQNLVNSLTAGSGGGLTVKRVMPRDL